MRTSLVRVMSSRLEWAFVAQMKGQMVAVDQAANIGIQFQGETKRPSRPAIIIWSDTDEAHAGRCGRQSRRCWRRSTCAPTCQNGRPPRGDCPALCEPIRDSLLGGAAYRVESRRA